VVSNVKKPHLRRSAFAPFMAASQPDQGQKPVKRGLFRRLQFMVEKLGRCVVNTETVAYLRELEDVAWVLGMMTGTRTRGPKPKNYQLVSTLETAKRWIAIDALGLRRKNK
jgi:hypothetical protein